MTENNNNFFQILVTFLGLFHALTFQQWISLGVLFTAIISLLINWYYKQQREKREQQNHTKPGKPHEQEK